MSVKVGGWADAVLVYNRLKKNATENHPENRHLGNFSHTKNATLGKNVLRQSPQKTLFPFRIVSGQLQPKKSPQKIRHLGKKSKRKNVKFIYYIIDKCCIQTCLK